MARAARTLRESRAPEPTSTRASEAATLIDRSARGERLQALVQFVRGRPTAPVVQRDGEMSPGLDQAVKDARKATKDKTKDEILDALANIGAKRLEDLKSGGEKKSGKAEDDGPTITKIEKHPFGYVEDTIGKPAKGGPGKLVDVVTDVFNRGLEKDKSEKGYKVHEEVRRDAKGLKVASCANTFQLTNPTFSKDKIVGMIAKDNFITRDRAEDVGGLRVFMSQVVERQYHMVEENFSKAPKASEGEGGIRLPFVITRGPAPGTDLAQALTAPSCEKESNGAWTTRRELATLGSEHGTLPYRLCLERGGFGPMSLTITFETGGNPIYTLDKGS